MGRSSPPASRRTRAEPTSPNSACRHRAEAARKKYWSCVEAENDIFEFPPAPMGVSPGSLVLDTLLDRTPTREDIEDVVDAWNFSPGDLSPVVTKSRDKSRDKTVWVLHGFESTPTELFNLLGPGFRKKRQRVSAREAYRRICQAWNPNDTALVLAFLRLHADDATLDRQGRRMIELWSSSQDSWRFRMISWIRSELSRPRERTPPLGWRKAALAFF